MPVSGTTKCFRRKADSVCPHSNRPFARKRRRIRKITVLLNFPQNPSGYTITEAEADSIVAILTDIAAGGTYVLAVTDDAYFGLFYEPQTLKESIFARLCGAHPGILAVKLDGATKENYVWGVAGGLHHLRRDIHR